MPHLHFCVFYKMRHRDHKEETDLSILKKVLKVTSTCWKHLLLAQNPPQLAYHQHTHTQNTKTKSASEIILLLAYLWQGLW